ncbi:hypothetical protein [Rhodococcus sp. IEGM1428]|uniref:hypothetical protein n=1 Tax=Rhodococcus sp. IEGM1428 TaxID=3392191 RepID=UPI003D0FA4BA
MHNENRSELELCYGRLWEYLDGQPRNSATAHSLRTAEGRSAGRCLTSSGMPFGPHCTA